MSQDLARALQQLLIQQSQQPSNPPPATHGGLFGGSMNSVFGQPPEDMYDGKITDQEETMREERRPDGTVIRTVKTYRWFGQSHHQYRQRREE